MSEESWFDTVAREAAEGTSATDAVNAVMPGGLAAMGAAKAAADTAVRLGAAGSWSFDKEEIEAVIADWKQLEEQLREDRGSFQQAALVSPPSEDSPSQSFIRSLTDGLSALRDSNTSMHKYVKDFIDKLEVATSAIGQADAADGRALYGADINEV